jgi:hypothetical protein
VRAFKRDLLATAGTIEAILKRDDLIQPFIEDAVRRRGLRRQEKLKHLRGLLPGANVQIAGTNRKVVEISWLSPMPPILADPQHPGEQQPCILVCYLAAYPTSARAITAHSGWALEVPDHAAARFLQRTTTGDLRNSLFAAGLNFLAADAERVVPLVGTGTSIYLKAGDGAFACTCIGAKTANGERHYTYARAQTWLSDAMLKSDQSLLPRASTPEQTVALSLWHWGEDTAYQGGSDYGHDRERGSREGFCCS